MVKLYLKIKSRLRHELYKGTWKDRSLSQVAIRKLLNSDEAVIFEIGCADGLDTEIFLKTFSAKKFRMYCFEPESRNIEKFKQRITDSRAKLFEIALGRENGQQEFHVSSTEYSSSLREPNYKEFQKQWPTIAFENKQTVKVSKLDDVVENLGLEMIDFIWADVQGAEDLLILGGSDTFDKKVKYFYTEYSNIPYYKGEPNLEAILELLGENWTVMADYGSDVLLRNRILTDSQFPIKRWKI